MVKALVIENVTFLGETGYVNTSEAFKNLIWKAINKINK